MQNYKAVFIDIDGTLVANRNLVSSAHEAVQRLKHAGVRVVLCTGRALVHTRRIQRTLDIQDAVYFNGGLAVTGADVVLSLPLDKSTTRKAMEAADQHDLPVILHSLSNMYTVDDVPHRIESVLNEFEYPGLTRTDMENILTSDADIYQMNVFMREQMDARMGQIVPECLIYRWHEEAVDLQRLGCDKSLGATALMKKWDIAAEQTVHIGDGGNDIGMFHTVGMSVAMGNATDDVKQHAAYVTATADEHGVLKALEHLRII